MDDQGVQLADRIRVVRHARGMRREDLAGAAGITPGTLAHIEERGERYQPRLQTIQALAAALDVNPYWLRYGDRVRPNA